MVVPVTMKVLGPTLLQRVTKKAVEDESSRRRCGWPISGRGWDPYAPELRQLMEKFEYSPMLRVSDVVMADIRGKLKRPKKDNWHPRRYSTV